MFLTEIRHNGSQISLGVNTIKESFEGQRS